VIEMDDSRIPHRAEPGQQRLDPVDARSATKKGGTQYVLVGGLALVVVIFAIIYAVYFA
jgi:hypothetical protein